MVPSIVAFFVELRIHISHCWNELHTMLNSPCSFFPASLRSTDPDNPWRGHVPWPSGTRPGAHPQSWCSAAKFEIVWRLGLCQERITRSVIHIRFSLQDNFLIRHWPVALVGWEEGEKICADIFFSFNVVLIFSFSPVAPKHIYNLSNHPNTCVYL